MHKLDFISEKFFLGRRLDIQSAFKKHGINALQPETLHQLLEKNPLNDQEKLGCLHILVTYNPSMTSAALFAAAQSLDITHAQIYFTALSSGLIDFLKCVFELHDKAAPRHLIPEEFLHDPIFFHALTFPWTDYMEYDFDNHTYYYSALFYLITRSIDIIQPWLKKTSFILEDTFFNILLNPQAYPKSKKANSSLLYCLLQTKPGIEILESWITNPIFAQKFLEHPHLLDTLLTIIPNEENQTGYNETNTSAFYWLLQHNPRINLLNNQPFIEALIAHPRFLDTLCAKRPDLAKEYENYSCLFLLVAELPQHKELPINIFTITHLAEWGKKTNHLTTIIDTLFAAVLDDKKLSFVCVFQKILENYIHLPNLIRIFLENPSVKKAIFQQYSLEDSTEPFFRHLLKTSSGFLLINQLIKFERTALLNAAHLPSLFKKSQIQQLIQMQHIKPEWFLFLAAYQPDNTEDMIFFLERTSISPWAINTSGRFLYEIIPTILGLSISHQQWLQEQLKLAMHRSRKEQSERNIIIHFFNTLSPQPHVDITTKALEENPHPSEENTLATIHPEPSTKNISTIASLTTNITAHIEWIIAQTTLRDFHEAFHALSNNARIKNVRDYQQLLPTLQKLCTAMQQCITKKNIPSFDKKWQGNLQVCITGVIDCLNQMYSVFTSEHPFVRYRHNIEKTITANYTRLLAVPDNMEIHTPPDMIATYLGMPFETLPPYDPYLLQWSPLQKQWVAQSCAEPLLDSESWLKEEMVTPLIDAVLAIFPEEESIITIQFSTLTDAHPVMIAMTLFNESPIFSTPFTTPAFLAFILSLNEQDIIAYMTEDIENTTTHIQKTYVEKNIRPKILEQFAAWLENTEQANIPKPRDINIYSTLLWQYLSQTHIPKKLENPIQAFLKKLPTAIDTLALFKYCLVSHKEQINQIKLERLFEPLPIIAYNPPSLLTLLLANPFYTAWFLEFEILVPQTQSRENQGIRALQFKKTIGIGVAPRIYSDPSLKKKLSRVYEAALAQKGGIFFALYYLRSHCLYRIIIDFISAKKESFFTYDSLLPLLYDLQTSALVSTTHKIVVQDFIEERLQLNLQNQDPAYWEFYCYLKENPLKKRPSILEIIQKNPWLDSDTQRSPLNHARNFLFNDPAELVPIASQFTKNTFFSPLDINIHDDSKPSPKKSPTTWAQKSLCQIL